MYYFTKRLNGLAELKKSNQVHLFYINKVSEAQYYEIEV